MFTVKLSVNTDVTHSLSLQLVSTFGWGHIYVSAPWSRCLLKHLGSDLLINTEPFLALTATTTTT